jgi:hypothetical protein
MLVDGIVQCRPLLTNLGSPKACPSICFACMRIGFSMSTNTFNVFFDYKLTCVYTVDFAWGTISIRTVYQQAETRAKQFAPDSKQAFSLKAFRLRLAGNVASAKDFT